MYMTCTSAQLTSDLTRLVVFLSLAGRTSEKERERERERERQTDRQKEKVLYICETHNYKRDKCAILRCTPTLCMYAPVLTASTWKTTHVHLLENNYTYYGHKLVNCNQHTVVIHAHVHCTWRSTLSTEHRALSTVEMAHSFVDAEQEH